MLDLNNFNPIMAHTNIQIISTTVDLDWGTSINDVRILRDFFDPFLPLVQILFTDPLSVKSEFHGPPPSLKFGHRLWMLPSNIFSSIT